MTASIEEDTFVASMVLMQKADKSFKALVKVGEQEPEWVDVPPQLAAQLPMALAMLQNG